VTDDIIDHSCSRGLYLGPIADRNKTIETTDIAGGGLLLAMVAGQCITPIGRFLITGLMRGPSQERPAVAFPDSIAQNFPISSLWHYGTTKKQLSC
jgi:hypothetical protein